MKSHERNKALITHTDVTLSHKHHTGGLGGTVGLVLLDSGNKADLPGFLH